MNEVLKLSWQIANNSTKQNSQDNNNDNSKIVTAGDDRTRLQALSLINDCYKYIMDLTTNGVVITDAIKFIQTNREKLTASRNEDNGNKETEEPDYNEDKGQLKENEVALWPPVQKERYLSDIASGIKFRSSLESSVLGITDPEMSKWVQERLTPHPYSTYEDAPHSGSLQSASIPRTYIHCTQGPISSWMEPFAARARDLGWDVYSMDVGHGVMITHPDELAKILIQVAKR